MSNASRTTINKMLRDNGLHMEVQKSDGCMYFTGEDTIGAYSTTVYVPYFNSLSLERWLAEALAIKTN